MKIKTIVLSLILGVFISCQTDLDNPEIYEFVKPKIVNTQFDDSVKSTKFKAGFVSGVFPSFVGKYSFTNRIDINPQKRDTTIFEDFFREYSYIELEDSIDVNGFELIVDYEQSVMYDEYSYMYPDSDSFYEYYPVYFVNSTKTDKMFFGKDRYAFGIQEAFDNDSNWRPIEKRGFDFCGNGHWGLVVHPNEFVVVLMRKYEGVFKTGIRVRFVLGESVYVSKPFEGTINPNQFNVQDSLYLEKLRERIGNAATWLFYGYPLQKEKEWSVKAF